MNTRTNFRRSTAGQKLIRIISGVGVKAIILYSQSTCPMTTGQLHVITRYRNRMPPPIVGSNPSLTIRTHAKHKGFSGDCEHDFDHF